MARSEKLGSVGDRENKDYQEDSKMSEEEDQVINQEYQVDEGAAALLRRKERLARNY